MARLFIALATVVAVLVLVEAETEAKGEKAAKRCARLIKKFEACLSRGYQSGDGCTADRRRKPKRQDVRRCRKFEAGSKTCGYTCKKPEPEIQPEVQPEVQPEIQPEVEEYPFDLNCKKEGLDFMGADIKDFTASTFEDCALKCSQEPACKAITFRSSDSHCWLKNRKGGQNGPTNNADVTSMNMDCDQSPVDVSCRRNGVDYYGADLTSLVSDGFKDCVRLCRDTEQCQAITFRNSDKRCWLKNKRGGAAGPSSYPGLISMNIQCDHEFDPTDASCLEGALDYRGADIRDFKSEGYEDCRTGCHDTADCKAFTMQEPDNHCWLKNKEGGYVIVSQAGLISANMNCEGTGS